MKIGRILIGLETGPESMAALEEAAEMAARLKAELVGLYVEDINLVSYSALPFAQEVGSVSAQFSGLDVAEVERRMRGLARRLKEAVEQAAARRHVRCSFVVRRGEMVTEIARQAGERDMILVVRRQHGGSAPACVNWQASISRECHRPVLFLPEHSRLRARKTSLSRTGVVVGASGEANHDRVSQALALAQAIGAPNQMLFLLHPGQRDDEGSVERDIGRIAEEHGVHATFVHLTSRAWSELKLALVSRNLAALFVFDAANMCGEPFQRFLDRVDFPVIALR